MVTKKSPSAAKAAPKAAPAKAQADSDAPDKAVAPKGPSLRIKELVDKVAAATGGKKKDVKATVEATLAEIGHALGRGEDLNLPGFGRARIARTAERGDASMLTLKVKRGPHKARPGAGEPLADDAEES